MAEPENNTHAVAKSAQRNNLVENLEESRASKETQTRKCPPQELKGKEVTKPWLREVDPDARRPHGIHEPAKLPRTLEKGLHVTSKRRVVRSGQFQNRKRRGPSQRCLLTVRGPPPRDYRKMHSRVRRVLHLCPAMGRRPRSIQKRAFFRAHTLIGVFPI